MNRVKVITVAALLTSTSVLAHSGHDHNAVDAGLVHFLWLAPIIIALVVISYRKIKAKSDKNI